MSYSFKFAAALASLLMLFSSTPFAHAQVGTATPATRLLPSSAFMASTWDAQTTLKQEYVKWLPTEVADAWLKKAFQLDLQAIDKVLSWSALPAEAGDDMVTGFIITLTQDTDLSQMDRGLLTEDSPLKVDGKTVYAFDTGNQQNRVFAYQDDPRTIVFASESDFEQSMQFGGAPSELVQLLDATVADGQESRTIILMDPVRPIINEMIASEVDEWPPQLQSLKACPDLIETLVLDSQSVTGSDSFASKYKIVMKCDNETDAQKLQGLLTQGIDDAQDLIIEAMMQGNDPDGDRVKEATNAYLQRLVRHFGGLIELKQTGNTVSSEAEINMSVGTAGVLVGLLLPAVQAAREAARRMTASNNLKQIGLAMHNHHATYKRLPSPAIRDEDGKPLLSWRVAILPFIEEQALYEEFHLDEPWDSPHNIKLLDRMPEVYTDPSLPLPAGQTVFQALVGEELMFNPEGESKFRDILDGLSNTLMVVEADASEAVEWTKPADLEVNMDNPIPQMGHIHPGGFHVLMGDGAVVFITHSIDLELFKGMLTKNGREVIDHNF